jgi:hypothetical protein
VLVALALVDLGRLATGPDRFTDAPRRAAGSTSEEVTPKRNDPRRVAPDLLDRHEAHPLGIGAKFSPEHSAFARRTATRAGSPMARAAARKGAAAARNCSWSS